MNNLSFNDFLHTLDTLRPVVISNYDYGFLIIQRVPSSSVSCLVEFKVKNSLLSEGYLSLHNVMVDVDAYSVYRRFLHLFGKS